MKEFQDIFTLRATGAQDFDCIVINNISRWKMA